MFVRWKRRKRSYNRGWGHSQGAWRAEEAGDSLDAVLVKTKRVGKRVQQKVICYLGSVHEKKIEKMFTRVDFWDEVTPKLDALNLSSQERTTIEISLNKTIPRPAEDEAAQFKKEREAYFAATREIFKALFPQRSA